MNNKRQTIWLVSMLSLMVILSAYYLFTEDVAPNPDTSTIQSAQNNGVKSSSSNSDGITVTEVDHLEEDLAAADNGITPEDIDVLKEMTNLKASQILDQTQRERMEMVSKKAEELSTVLADSKVSQEEAIQASEELSRLEDTDLRITSLQEKLLQDFENAVVSEVDTNFKVIVLSDKLEKKQAVGIVEMAMKELNVTPDRVTVQYVQ